MPLFSDSLNKIDSGTVISSLTDLITDIGYLSGPGDMLFCRAKALLNQLQKYIRKGSHFWGQSTSVESNSVTQWHNFVLELIILPACFKYKFYTYS